MKCSREPCAPFRCGAPTRAPVGKKRKPTRCEFPKGVQAGQSIRVTGKGGEGSNGGGAGDIYLRVRYAQHPDWQVRGADLMGHLELAPWEAVLGATVPVPTLEGSVSVKVPAGFQQGQKLRVRGKGLPAGGTKRGDLYVEASIQVPHEAGKEEERLWKELAVASGFNPRKIRMSKSRKRILMVEDDVDVSRLNTEELKQAGYLVDNIENGAAAWDVLQRASYHLLITDQHWPKLSGIELLKQIREAHMTLPIIMITDISPQLEFIEHPWIQPATMLVEPYSSAELLGMVEKALSANAGVEENTAPSPSVKNQPARRRP